MIQIKTLTSFSIKRITTTKFGNAYLEFDMKVHKVNDKKFEITNDPATNEEIRLLNNGFTHSFEEARLGTTGNADLKRNKYIGQFSSNTRASTNKDGDLLSQFDKIDETEAQKKNTSLKHKLINSQEAANRRKNKGQLPLEHIFGFCKTFKKLTKT